MRSTRIKFIRLQLFLKPNLRFASRTNTSSSLSLPINLLRRYSESLPWPRSLLRQGLNMIILLGLMSKDVWKWCRRSRNFYTWNPFLRWSGKWRTRRRKIVFLEENISRLLPLSKLSSSPLHGDVLIGSLKYIRNGARLLIFIITNRFFMIRFVVIKIY